MSDAVDEVIRQHVFIEAWMSGAPVDPTEWQLFADVLADDFVIVPPSGVAKPKAALLQGFEAARGVMPGVRVEIRNAHTLYRAADIEVVRYEEWQLHDEQANQRISTAVFVPNAEMPLGWSWMTLHETTLPTM